MNLEKATSNTRFKLTSEKNDGKTVTVVRANGLPEGTDWTLLHDEVRQLLLEDMLAWRFDLTSLERTDSETLGLLLTLSATIENRNGQAEFVVTRDSYLEKTLQLTKLDQILNMSAR